MGTKEEVSNNYMSDLKRTYGDLPTVPSAKIVITGAWNDGSIGKEIAAAFDPAKVLVLSKNFDIRYDIESIDLSAFDTLIMCHGVMRLDWLEDVSPAIVSDIVDINLTSSMKMVSSFVRSTINSVPIRRKIISIGSMAYKAVLNGSSAYCASKAGLAQFMKCAAWELAPKGYDVYSIHPSNTEDANMSRETIVNLARYRNISLDAAKAYWAANNPRNEFLSKQEISDLVQFLCSGKAAYLSGANLELAGGQR